MTPRMTSNFHLSVVHIFWYWWCVGHGATFLSFRGALFFPKDILALFENRKAEQNKNTQISRFQFFFMPSHRWRREWIKPDKEKNNQPTSIRKKKNMDNVNGTILYYTCIVCRWNRQVGNQFLATKLNQSNAQALRHPNITENKENAKKNWWKFSWVENIMS